MDPDFEDEEVDAEEEEGEEGNHLFMEIANHRQEGEQGHLVIEMDDLGGEEGGLHLT